MDYWDPARGPCERVALRVMAVRSVAGGERKSDVAHGHLYWDILGVYAHLLTGIGKAGRFSSLGVDSFCNDYGLPDESGTLYSQVFMYRDTLHPGYDRKNRKTYPPARAVPPHRLSARTLQHPGAIGAPW